MASPPQGNSSPPKPWERSGAQSAAPFEASSPGSTSDVVENSGVAKAGEVVAVNNNGPINRNSAGGLPPTNGNNLGAYGSSFNYNSGPYGSGVGYGGAYGGSLYGNSLYNRGYGGSYGGYGSNGGYGSYGGLYNGNYGGSYGNYGMGMGMGMGMGGPYNEVGPNGPFGQPAPPPGFWISFINMMGNVVQAFSRIAMLVNENTSALHMLMTALLQVFGHSGRLYGELAPFVLRLLGLKPRAQKLLPQPHPGAPLPAPEGQKFIEGPMAANAGLDKYWDNN